MICRAGRSTTPTLRTTTFPTMRLGFPLRRRSAPTSQRRTEFPSLVLEDLEREGTQNVRVIRGEHGAGWSTVAPGAEPGAEVDGTDSEALVIELRDRAVVQRGTTEVAHEAQGAGSLIPATRMERALLALAWRSEALATRVEQVERRLAGLADDFFEGATQSDLIEVEARRARLAAEVARMGTELRGALDQQAAHVAQVARDLAEVPKIAADHARKAVDSRRVETLRPAVNGGTRTYAPLGAVLPLEVLADLDTLPADLLDRS